MPLNQTEVSMKLTSAIWMVIILMTASVSWAVDTQKSKSTNYPLSTTLETADSSWVLQLIQNELYWGVQELESGDFVVTATNATVGGSWTKESSWNGNTAPEDFFNELSAGVKEVRFLPVGTDSVVLVISGPDSTYLYRRYATYQSAPYIWTRTALNAVFDSLQYTTIQGDTIIRNYPNAISVDVPGMTIISRSFGVDIFGNEYFVGEIAGKKVFAKNEVSSGKVIYWEYGIDVLPIFDPTNISYLIAGRGGVDSIYINHPVYVVEDTIYVSALADTLLNGDDIVRIYHPITIIDDNQTIHQSVPIVPVFSDWIRYSGDTTYLEISASPVTIGATYPLRYRIIDRSSSNDTSPWLMEDTVCMMIKVVNDSMKVTDIVDQQATESQSFSVNVVVSNGMWPAVESFTGPSWLTINNFTISGTPTHSDVGGEVVVAILDTMIQYRGITHTQVTQRDTVRFNITVEYLPNAIPTISVTQSADTIYIDESLACTTHVADADGDQLITTYGIVANASFTQNNDSLYIVTFGTTGSYALIFKVNDGEDSASAQIDIEVIDRPTVNIPPVVANDTVRTKLGDGDWIRKVIQATDDDNDQLMYDFGNGFTLDSTYVYEVIEADTFDVEVKVTDGTDTVTCILTVMIEDVPTTTITNLNRVPANDFAKLQGSRIDYGIKSAGQIKIVAITLDGRIVAKVNAYKSAGSYFLDINSSTPVIVQVIVGSIRQMMKITTIK